MVQKKKTPWLGPKLKIDGHTYEQVSSHKTKKRALEIAEKEHRSEGRSARVIKSGITSTHPWSVYARQYHHRRTDEWDPKTRWWKIEWVYDD